MLIINHRVNTLSQLESLKPEAGAEVDVRYHEDQLVLAHDPFGHQRLQPQNFADYLSGWKQKGPLIVNLKTEGVEQRCIELLRKSQVSSWFFLDMSQPYLVRFSLKAQRGEIAGFGPDNLAVRYSEYEAIEYALGFAPAVRWVWVDYFQTGAMTQKAYEDLKNRGFRICLVSPELQGHQPEVITAYRHSLQGMEIDAVCTKQPALWS